MQRRDFFKKAVVGGIAGASMAVPALASSKKVKLKLATSWPARFPIMGTGVETFAKRVKKLSGGSLVIKVYPAGVLVPALSVFDATSKGQIDAFHSGPYYWKGKNPAFSLFTGFPFGFTHEEHSAWMLHGGGLKLWRKLYAKYNLYPMMGGNTGTQMGGWFRKEIKSMADLKGLKMRIPGLGGEVMAKMGVNPVLMPAGEIYTSLERGVIDATEWIAPAHDLKMGFHKVAKHYYTGWHEPGSMLELTFNKESWKKLSKEHQAIIESVSAQMNSEMAYEFQAANAKAYAKLAKSKKVKVDSFPDSVVDGAKKAFDMVIKEQSSQSKDFKKVWKSCDTFLNKNRAWSAKGVKAYLNTRA
jgi:TRAP-type mannitol/chloroaromatic compound transport system substrate-binding protein